MASDLLTANLAVGGSNPIEIHSCAVRFTTKRIHARKNARHLRGPIPVRPQLATINGMSSVCTDFPCPAPKNELQMPIIPNIQLGIMGEKVCCEFGPNSQGSVNS
jgi:hypothetical protein